MGLPCFIGRVLDNKIIIENEEYHHAINVKRLKLNDRIEVNDLSGNFFVGTIYKIEKNSLIVIIEETVKKIPSRINITLYQCLLNKLSKIDELIESISQLNVTTFVPVMPTFSSLKSKDIQNKIQKWQKIAIQSIKQCKRLFPVNIQNPQKLYNIDPIENLKIVFYENEKNKTLKDINIQNINSLAIIIGPEGGFSKDEITYLQKKGFIPLSLSDNILKTEIATIVALSQIELKFR
ncbi:MAG: RsmE family RNA methyltransferase [Desulfurella sp.]|uniref:RsmE family RNA methyltransferase n=1 Tax=Desulfurella sp. TaxID=1962857 RepID=UPI003CC162A6